MVIDGGSWLVNNGIIILQCEAPKIAKLVNLTPMSLWFVVRK